MMPAKRTSASGLAHESEHFQVIGRDSASTQFALVIDMTFPQSIRQIVSNVMHVLPRIGAVLLGFVLMFFGATHSGTSRRRRPNGARDSTARHLLMPMFSVLLKIVSAKRSWHLGAGHHRAARRNSRASRKVIISFLTKSVRHFTPVSFFRFPRLTVTMPYRRETCVRSTGSRDIAKAHKGENR
jgi:hypothetical protein